MRLVSFNIRHGRRRGRVDVGALRRACRALGADVLALQEVDVGTTRVAGANLASEVAEACAMEATFIATLAMGPGHYGNALLVRGALEDVAALALPAWPGNEARGAVLATAVVAGGARLSVAGCHLGLGLPRPETATGPATEAEVQLAAVLAGLAERPAPRALLGDLNLSPDRVGPLVASAGMALAGGPPTYPARRPSRRIDHAALAGMEPTAVTVPRVPVSDHRPLVVEAELSP